MHPQCANNRASNAIEPATTHDKGNAMSEPTRDRRITDRKNVPKPTIFEGRKEDFFQWSREILRYATVNLRDARKLMDWSEKQEKERVRVKDVEHWGKENGIDDARHIDEEIHLMLTTYTKNKAYNTVDMCGECGCEAWRRLHEQYNPNAQATKMSLRTKINHPPTNIPDDKLIEQIEKWELEIIKLRQMFGEEVDDAQKITQLIAMCNTRTQEIAYRVSKCGDYETVKSEIIEYLQMKSDTNLITKKIEGVNQFEEHESRRTASGGEEEDVGALSKGKGNTKGKSKGMGKGACARCGKMGHWANECMTENPFPYPCNSCGMVGHRAADCRRGKSGNVGNKGKGKGSKGKKSGKGKDVNEFGIDHQECDNEEKDEWEHEEDYDQDEKNIGGISEENEEQDRGEMDLFYVGKNGNIGNITKGNRWQVRKNGKREGPENKLCSSCDKGHRNSCNNDCNGECNIPKPTNTILHRNKFAELQEADSASDEETGIMTLDCDGMKNTGKTKGDEGLWEKVTITVDSGAAISVMPEDIASELPIQESNASRNNTTFRAANGGILKSMGRRKIKGTTSNGMPCSASFEVSKVTKTLGAVSEMIDKGNKVVFDEDECYILNKETNRKTKIRRRGGAFEFDIYYEKVNSKNANGTLRSFRRQQ